jgi:hypothetical protein
VNGNSREALIGHSGLAFRDWEDKAIADFLAGRRSRLPTVRDFNREFVADRDGMMPPIVQVLNQITGEYVTLDEPLVVRVDDLDRVLEEFQRKFSNEWTAWLEDSARKMREEPREVEFPFGGVPFPPSSGALPVTLQAPAQPLSDPGRPSAPFGPS